MKTSWSLACICAPIWECVSSILRKNVNLLAQIQLESVLFYAKARDYSILHFTWSTFSQK